MDKLLRGRDEPHLGATKHGARVSETAINPAMIGQGLRLNHAFMSITDATARETVIRFAINLAKSKGDDLCLVTHF